MDGGYISSDKAQLICYDIMSLIELNTSEHKYYAIGSDYFAKPESEKDEIKLDLLNKTLGDQWQKIRFHNLVRLGGDIQATGLGEYHKATIMGAFLTYSKNQ